MVAAGVARAVVCVVDAERCFAGTIRGSITPDHSCGQGTGQIVPDPSSVQGGGARVTSYQDRVDKGIPGFDVVAASLISL